MNQLSDEQFRQVSEAILSGNKIAAIKVYREATGLGPKEAKEEVERITADLARDHPELLENQKKGCAALFFIAGVLSAGAIKFAAGCLSA